MKTLDQRESNLSLIAFYTHQARLARLGHTTRRSEEFYLRQAEYFRTEQR